ncbi:MAG: M20/M25/M40 family metallo-hydrolase [Planctomycetota bacterium]|nr:MAG: M20/M25/M40 family metallo-hydrolase [Planctomycetota bacterium]
MNWNWTEIYQEAQSYLQELLRFDTTNPPGNELPALEYLKNILMRNGVEAEILESAPSRGNLVARIPAAHQQSPPFLLASHVDVVPAEPDQWKYPPFSGVLEEGCIWGRGAVDMKTMVIFEVMAMILFQRRGIPLNRDLILAIVADEEAGGDFGMKWLVENHPEKIRAEYSFNEVGGFSLEVGSERVYPIQVAHKGALWLEVVFKGRPGHGSMPHDENPVLKLGKAIDSLAKPFPMKPLPLARQFLSALGKSSGIGSRILLALLTFPGLGEWILALLPKEKKNYINALLRNTVTPTGLKGSQKANVIPSEASIILDCRTLPGSNHQEFVKALKKRIGEECEIRVIHDLGPYAFEPWDSEIFQIIKETILLNDSQARVTPSLTVGFTDAKHLEPLGVKTYGFFPLKLPSGFRFGELFHGHNERIPISSFQWGLKVFIEALQKILSPSSPA